MRRWLRTGLLALCAGSLVCANDFPLDRGENQQQCSGMYSKGAWYGNIDPSINVKFLASDTDTIVSLVIFEFADENKLGRQINKDNPYEREYICGGDAVNQKFCNKENEGQFILSEGTTLNATSIYTEAVNLKDAKPIQYPIKRTGYYCVWSYPYNPPDYDYTGVVTFQNAYGELSAAQIAKLPFYGGMAILYAVILALWGFLYVQHRRDILPVQNYVTAILVVLVVEMLMTWAFYDYMNVHGANTGSKVLMVIVAILNAARNSFSFFLLLIVCMGYGVVKPSLGSLMKWVRILGLAHFVFGVVYAIASLTITPDTAGPLVMLVILPLAATLTAFYVWTLNSIKVTMKDLEERKQKTKLLMYRRLWWVLLGSILIIFGFFFINSFTFAGHSSPDFVPKHWRTRWFILDGWLNLVYLIDITSIAYLWRPTANNRRFAMSDELAQDDDGGFEIASIGGSELDEDEAEEGRAGLRDMGPTPPQNAAIRPPAPAARKQSFESDGEPIFEVGDGEDDAWSDGEDDSDEHDAGKRLTGKKD